MKKIIVAFDGLKYSTSTRDYAIELAGSLDAHIVGVFLDDVLYNSYNVYNLVVKKGLDDKQIKKYHQRDDATRDFAAADFKSICEKKGLHFSIHRDNNIAIQELKHESIYADLLILDANETLTPYKEKLPTRFIRDILADAQCPVMIVPHKHLPLEKIILLYDGEPSSVQAIRMFSYLMPQLATLPTEVITVKKSSNSSHVPDNKLMKEFMKRHFPKAKYTIMKGDAENEIVTYLNQSSANSLVVLGAYRRGTVSRWFKESMADVLMREVSLPLFIAHNV